MANCDTFKVPIIGAFVGHYLSQSKTSIDPFARNSRRCTHSNDLNPKTKAEYHMKALDFLTLIKTRGIKVDLVVFDPPCSMEQCKRVYESVGYDFTYDDSLYVIRWTHEKKDSPKFIEKGRDISSLWMALKRHGKNSRIHNRRNITCISWQRKERHNLHGRKKNI